MQFSDMASLGGEPNIKAVCPKPCTLEIWRLLRLKELVCERSPTWEKSPPCLNPSAMLPTPRLPLVSSSTLVPFKQRRTRLRESRVHSARLGVTTTEASRPIGSRFSSRQRRVTKPSSACQAVRDRSY